MEKRHIINLQGREYVTYEGLLDEAHKRGLCGIRTTIVQMPSAENEHTAVVTAEVDFLDKDGDVVTFSGIGDANPRNVSRGILPHLLRMSETRAKARAMRDGTNIGMTAFEEIEEADLPREQGESKRPAAAAWKLDKDEYEEQMGRVADAKGDWNVIIQRRTQRFPAATGFQKLTQAEWQIVRDEMIPAYLGSLVDSEVPV